MSKEDSRTEHMLSNDEDNKIKELLIDEEIKTEQDNDEDFEIPTKLNLIHYFGILIIIGLTGCTLAATIYAWIK